MANMTWAALSTNSRSAVGTCATGADTFGAAATDGMPLDSAVVGYRLFAAADAAQTITSGSLQAYLYNEAVARWGRCPDLDAVVGVAGQRDLGFIFPSSGVGIAVLGQHGRIAYAPNVVLSAGGLHIYLLAMDERGVLI